MAIPPDKSPDRIAPGKSTEPLGQPNLPAKEPTGFDAHMQGATQPKTSMPGTPGEPGGPTAVTPMGIPQGPAISTAGISYNSILAQANVAQDSLGTVDAQLNDKNLKLKRSQSHLVRQKLGDANGYIRAAGSKLGANMPEGKVPAGLTGIARFIAMVNDGQNQLVAVQQQLQQLSAKGEQINPGEMMAVQVKMNLAQQEIEYTSTLLGKVLTSINQIMTTQL
ncbi:MAG TPA: hypothetical protein VLF94_08415 [Chlamydiales bacterium]|nr:hypothetical protein [Chlamydiales bacterium]